MEDAFTFNWPGFTTPRPAADQDLDDITIIHTKGLTEKRQVHCCYPLRYRYRGDYRLDEAGICRLSRAATEVLWSRHQHADSCRDGG